MNIMNTQAATKQTLRFLFAANTVRTILVGEEIWFVLKDVCDILGIKNSRNVFTRLAGDEKGVHQTDTLGGKQNVQCVNEAGLYDTILRSDSPNAVPFRRWVTHEVLPAIRKQGFYSTIPDDKLVELLQTRLKQNPRLLETVKVRKSLSAELTLNDLHNKRADLSRDEYLAEMRRICGDNIRLQNKEFLDYTRWLGQIHREQSRIGHMDAM